MEERLQKWIARCGVCSRRAAEQLLRQGRVTLNGRVAGLGESGDPERDTLLVDGRPVAAAPEPVYLMLNKPRGYVTTLSDERGRKTAAELVADCGRRVFPVGRLDKDSEGLLLMTNNGEILNKMMRAGNYHEKEYLVRVNRPVTEAFLSGMAKGGIPVQEQQTRPCNVEKTGERTFRIILTQGLNSQIRRMCEYFGYQVVKMKRIRIMNIMLGDLPTGSYREISREEQEELYRRIQGSSNQPVRENRGRREEWKKKDSE